MLQALETRAATEGFRELVLETNLDWDDARGFYRARGYREVARSAGGVRFSKLL